MGVKIYFCGSVRAGREDAPLYVKIVNHLKKYGQVLTEHVAMPDVEKSAGVAGASSKKIHDISLEWLADADVLVAEVTKPSLGVGYEIGRAVAMAKPCLILYRPEANPDARLSAMIEGAEIEGIPLTTKYYKEPEVYKIIDDYMLKFKETE